jgi:hypothetical protein
MLKNKLENKLDKIIIPDESDTETQQKSPETGRLLSKYDSLHSPTSIKTPLITSRVQMPSIDDKTVDLPPNLSSYV